MLDRGSAVLCIASVDRIGSGMWIAEDHTRLGPEMTMSISPGYRLCRAILEQVAGVCGEGSISAVLLF
jgi:hypothetical protein